MSSVSLEAPPAHPVWWRVTKFRLAPWVDKSVVRNLGTVRIFAKTWFEARSIAFTRIPGAAHVELQQESLIRSKIWNAVYPPPKQESK